MKKDLHIRIDSGLFDEIENRAKEKKITIAKECTNLFQYSLMFESMLEKLNLMLKELEQLGKDTSYTKKLLIQSYVDMDMEQKDPKKSDNLINFNKKFRNSRMND